MNNLVAVVDYGFGNVRRVASWLRNSGYEPKLIESSGQIRKFRGIVFPGVGSFGSVAPALAKNGWRDVIESAQDGQSSVVTFCICSAAQALYESSDEAPGVNGLGLFSGNCPTLSDRTGISINVGRREVTSESGLEGSFYHLHRYLFPQHNQQINKFDAVSWSTINGVKVKVAVQKGRLYCLQFHPELSGSNGVGMISQLLQF